MKSLLLALCLTACAPSVCYRQTEPVPCHESSSETGAGVAVAAALLVVPIVGFALSAAE